MSSTRSKKCALECFVFKACHLPPPLIEKVLAMEYSNISCLVLGGPSYRLNPSVSDQTLALFLRGNRTRLKHLDLNGIRIGPTGRKQLIENCLEERKPSQLFWT